MSAVTKYAPGTFCWIELCTTDGDAAKKFYTELLGLGFSDQPISEDMVYTLLTLGDKNVGALYQQNEEQKSRGVPPHWISYVSVASADDAAGKAASLGATLIDAPFDVFDVGRMAIIQDPTGAIFAIWQPKAHIGAAIVNEPGSWCWNELVTNDTAKAGEFYAGLFDWSANTDKSETPYTLFMAGDQMRGGMIEIAKEWGEVPPNWMVYFAVADCDGSFEQAKRLGAQVLAPPQDVPEVGRFACLQDPQGAVFSIIKLDGQK